MFEGQPCLISRALGGAGEQESKWTFMQYHLLGIAKRQRLLDSPSSSSCSSEEENESPPSDYYQSGSLIQFLGRDISVNCLLRCSRSDYGAIASLNRNFRSLIRSGELYRLRRLHGISEQWVYFSCNVHEWESFDPQRRRWFFLPRMPQPNECFIWSDKESLAVGTELLVFGKEETSHIVLRYSILSNAWSAGAEMRTPRCLFGSASAGAIAIVAGGCSVQGNIYSSAELYNSETQTWTDLPVMNVPRKMCSGVFMDKKFYVIGGTNPEGALTCGEEFDPETGRWRLIPNMYPPQGSARGAPPLVAVVKDELYAADCSEKTLIKYVKEKNSWVKLGNLPERPVSVNGWGLAFRACGDRLIVIGGPRAMAGGNIEINSWVPGDGVPEWELIARKPSGGFVYNCAVMGC